jgi:phosphopantetheinyl transferase (holo-ACP synthase)
MGLDVIEVQRFTGIVSQNGDTVLNFCAASFEMNQINHKKLLKEKGQKESTPEAGCRG